MRAHVHINIYSYSTDIIIIIADMMHPAVGWLEIHKYLY